MSLVINNNLMAMNASRNLSTHYSNLSDSTRKLSSGLRVESAADDAAGLAIRELMRADIASLNQGVRNANDAVSLIQTADGALGIIDEKLIRMKELAEQAATGTYDSVQRAIIDSEYQQMASEITRIANATDFNGIKLLDGSLSAANASDVSGTNHYGWATAGLIEADGDEYANGDPTSPSATSATADPYGGYAENGLNSTGPLKVHFGTGNDSDEDYYYITIQCCTASALGVGNSIDPTQAGHNISTQANAQNALDAINAAIVSKDNIRAHLGAMQNRLENTISNLTIQAENLQAAESQISDVDVATEMTEFVRNQTLASAANSMLSQANNIPQMALSLIG